MAVKISNNAISTLAASITAGATSISLAAGTGSKFPALSGGDWFPLTLVDASANREIVRVTARAGDVLTVERGQEGTAALPFAAGNKAELRITAAVFAELTSQIASAQSAADSADKTDIGMIVMSGNNAAPSRGTWLKCDGTAVRRTTYAGLFAKLSTTYGAGNGSTTFNLPDFRGVVPRGLDEGRGLDTGRALSNAVQADQNKSHTHGASSDAQGTHQHEFSGITTASGAHDHAYYASVTGGPGTAPDVDSTAGAQQTGYATSAVGDHAHYFGGTTSLNGGHAHNITVSAEGGSEARMKNIATIFWIRAA